MIILYRPDIFDIPIRATFTPYAFLSCYINGTRLFSGLYFCLREIRRCDQALKKTVKRLFGKGNFLTNVQKLQIVANTVRNTKNIIK